MTNAWKIGIGSGYIILGIYFLFNRVDIYSVVFGVIAVAFGIGLIASDLK